MATDSGIGVAMTSSLCGVGSTSSGAGVGIGVGVGRGVMRGLRMRRRAILEHSLLAGGKPDICGGIRVCSEC